MYIKLTATGVLNKHQALLSRTAKITKYSLIQTTNKSVKIIKKYIFTYSFLNEFIYTRIDKYHNSVAPLFSTLSSSPEAPVVSRKKYVLIIEISFYFY